MAKTSTTERVAAAGAPGLSFNLGLKFNETPLCMRPETAMWLQGAIENKAFDSQVNIHPESSRFVGELNRRSRFRVTEDGIAIVGVHGVLVDRGDWLGQLWGYFTSYEGLTEQCRRLENDSSVKAVVFDIDSGGGMASGLPEFSTCISELRKKKKVYAIAQNMAASAAYWIGCSADEFYATEQSISGSIGVIMVHMSYAAAMEKAGLESTIIYAGDHKPNANPYQPLSHVGRAELTERVDEAYDGFVRHVSKHRKLDEHAVRATQARIYNGASATKEKLIDGVKSFDELLAYIRSGSQSKRGQSSKKGGPKVSNESQTPAAQSDDLIQQIAAAVAAIKPEAAAGVTPSGQHVTQTPSAETKTEQTDLTADDAKARIKAILGCDAAKKLQAAANHLALETDIDAETCIKVLGAMESEVSASNNSEPGGKKNEQQKPQSALGAAMENAKNSAGVEPDGATPAGMKSLAEKTKERFGKKSAA